MAGAFCTTIILLVIVADVTVFRQPLIAANQGTSTYSSMDDDCNDCTEGAQGLECQVFNHIKEISTLEGIYMKVGMIFYYCACWAVGIVIM